MKKEILERLTKLIDEQLFFINEMTVEQLQIASRRNMMRKQWNILEMNLKEIKNE
jgi:hypothetical protein